MSSTAAHHSRRSSPADSLTTYLASIHRYPLLTRSDDVRLARRIHDGDAAAANDLVCSNLRFVVSVAKKYQHRGVPLADLINEGNLGLMRAAEKFDETKGVRFLSYAGWWIRQAIFQALAEQAHTVRVPITQTAIINRVSRRTNSLAQELGREPTQQELSEDLQVSESAVERSLPLVRTYVSLDAPAGRRESAPQLDRLSEDDGNMPGEDIVSRELRASVQETLHCLKPREATVIRLYFGFDGDEPLTLEDIGARLGITRERVRQIKDKGLMRMRKSTAGRTLAEFRER